MVEMLIAVAVLFAVFLGIGWLGAALKVARRAAVARQQPMGLGYASRFRGRAFTFIHPAI